jgi:hypothetical protein
MDTGYFQFLSEPLKVWHLLAFALFFAITLNDMRKQITAIGKSVWRAIDSLEGRDPKRQ